MHGVRGVAVLFVVLYHIVIASEWMPNHAVPRAVLEATGFLAVDVLFFTSGFVLFLPVVLSGRFGSVGAFAIRRFARIAPPYYVCLLVILAAYPLLTSPAIASAARTGVTDYLIHVVFLQREILGSQSGLGVNGPLWVLSIDVAFYVLLPFIAEAYLRRPLVGLAIALGASTAWRVAFMGSATHPDLLIQFPLFAAYFAAGMTAAWLYLRLRDAAADHSRAAVTVAALGLAALTALAYAAGATIPSHLAVFQENTLVAALLPLALLAFVVAVSLGPAWVQRPLTNRAALWFSEISYSVFLYHVVLAFFAFESLGVELGGDLGALVTMGLAVLPASIVVGALSYRLIELPSRRYGRKLARRFTDAGTPGPGRTARARAAALRYGTSD